MAMPEADELPDNVEDLGEDDDFTEATCPDCDLEDCYCEDDDE